jgi:hypothetical protein
MGQIHRATSTVSESIDKTFPGTGTLQDNPMVVVKQQMRFDHGNQEDGNSRPTASTVGEFKSDSEYSIWQQNRSVSFANVPSDHFPGMYPKLFNPTVRRQVEFRNSRPTASTVDEFKSDSEYSIWQQNSYLGSYKIPSSLSFANLPSEPFPGMGSKLFNPTVRRQVEGGNSRPTLHRQWASLNLILNIQCGNRRVTWGRTKFLHHFHSQIFHQTLFQVWARSC